MKAVGVARRPPRALGALLVLAMATGLLLVTLWPSLPARGLETLEVRAQPRGEALDRVAALSGRFPRATPNGTCSPEALNVSNVKEMGNLSTEAGKQLYDALEEAKGELPPPPTFAGRHYSLCNLRHHKSDLWSYCLPMTGLSRDSRCANSSQWDWKHLVKIAKKTNGMVPVRLAGKDDEDDGEGEEGGEDEEGEEGIDEEDGDGRRLQEDDTYETYEQIENGDEDAYAPDESRIGSATGAEDVSCIYPSVLHMLLVDVYDVLKAHGLAPALIFGSMLGAVRDESIIPFTEDVDVGFRKNLRKKLLMKRVKEALFARGYHMFQETLYRVCLAPFHPLAGFLYNEDVSRRLRYHVPYVDLYPMTPEDDEARWQVDHTHNESYRIESSDFEPYSTVKVNGVDFDTLANPEAFLIEEYGVDYLTPKPREHDP